MRRFFTRVLPALVLAILVSISISPLSVQAAISYGTSASSGNVTSVTSQTFSFTVDSGASLLLVCPNTRNAASQTVTSVTYNGTGLTQAVGNVPAFTGTNWRLDAWYMTNPPAGTANIVVTMNQTGNMTMSAATYHGTATDGTVINAHSNNSTPQTSPISLTTTPTVDNTWGVMCGSNVDNAFNTSSTNFTLRTQASGVTAIGDSAGPVHPAAAYNQQMTYTGTRTGGAIQLMIAPAATPVSPIIPWLPLFWRI